LYYAYVAQEQSLLNTTIINYLNYLLMKKNVLLLAIIVLSAISFSVIAQEKGTVKDIDGNEYATLKIGSQEWMVENLKTTKYNDGSPIAHVKDAAAWLETEEGAYAVVSNLTSKDVVQKNGLLYNWYAVETEQLCPQGWYVPTEEEWEIFRAHVESTHGNLAKAIASTEGWKQNTGENTPGNNVSKNNASGFNAPPAGYRKDGDGAFSLHGSLIGFWSETQRSSKNAYSYILLTNSSSFEGRSNSKKSGFSVRCVRSL
jgi:uncharacterized protein (TIGR02145 family)